MIPLDTLFLMSLVFLIAFPVKAATGFGDALIMIPLLLLFLDMKFILPVILVTALFADCYLLYLFRKDIRKEMIFPLIIGSIAGAFLGGCLLSVLDNEVIKKVFAFFIVAFSIKMLFFEKAMGPRKRVSKILGSIAGFFGGLLDSLVGTGGPPIVIWLNYAVSNKGVFRATCVFSFFLFHLSRLLSYILFGLMTLETFGVGLCLIPAMIAGSMIGLKVHITLNERRFKNIIASILLISGVLLYL